jgi:hypothetical protein
MLAHYRRLNTKEHSTLRHVAMERHHSGNATLLLSTSRSSAAIPILPVLKGLAVLFNGGTVPASFESGVQRTACHRHPVTQLKK